MFNEKQSKREVEIAINAALYMRKNLELDLMALQTTIDNNKKRLQEAIGCWKRLVKGVQPQITTRRKLMTNPLRIRKTIILSDFDLYSNDLRVIKKMKETVLGTYTGYRFISLNQYTQAQKVHSYVELQRFLTLDEQNLLKQEGDNTHA